MASDSTIATVSRRPLPVGYGVVPPICTPLTPSREVDVGSLRRLCAFLLEAEVDGIFVGGSTGEASYLGDGTRLQVLRAVLDTVAGQVPVLAGVIDTATERVVEAAVAVEKAGAAGVVATAPFYAPTHPAEIDRHYRAVAAAVDVPVIAYDIPGFVHTALPADVIATLATDGVLAGLKDSSGDLTAMRTVLANVPSDFPVFTGSETVADLGLALGARGVVPGLGNVDPHGFVRLCRAGLAGDTATAAREQDRLRRLFGLIRAGEAARMGRYSSAIGAFKAALVLRGVIEHGTTSLPMIPLDEAEIAVVREHLDEAGLL